MGDSWTATQPLIGASTEYDSLDKILALLLSSYPQLPAQLLQRFGRSYGLLSLELLGKAQQVHELGQWFGADLYAQEVDYLMQHEWAQTPDDVLWRRTKLGLRFSDSEVEQLAGYMQARLQHSAQYGWTTRPAG